MSQQVNHKVIEHTIHQQAQAEKAILAEFQNGQFDLAQPLVKLNPYLIAPLTAMILFRTEDSVSVTIRVQGKTPQADITHAFPEGKEHILPIYGLYVDTLNKVEIQLSNGQSNTIEIQTLPPHKSLKFVTKIETTPEYLDGNMIALTVARNAHPAAYDYAGDCRWYSPLNFNFDLKRVKNGHFLIGSDRYVGAPYYTSGVVEMAFSGKIFKEYRIPGGYHHDQWEMEDGSLLILTQDLNSGTVEDMCVQVDRETGAIIKSWDYKDILPQDVAGSGSQDEEDWFHNNAVWYDKKTNSLTLSGRHQDAVINIDFETGALNWIIGDPEGWPQEMVEKYFFTPVGDGDFDWQYEQHACVILPDGDVMCFDNGHYRSKNPEKYLLGKDNFSRGVRYRINTENMTIEQIWQYGKERGAEFFSPYICNVEYYGEGHYLVHSGGIAFKDGVTPEGLGSQLSVKDPTIELNSITVEVKDDKVMLEMHVPANFYRAEKLPLYYDGEVFEAGEGQLLGSLGVTPQSKMKIKAQETGQIAPEAFKLSVVEETDRIQLNATFDEGTMAQLLLVDAQGEVLRYDIKTTSHNFGAMCVGTFQKADARETDKFVTKEGLSGQYAVKVLVEDKIYETGVSFKA